MIAGWLSAKHMQGLPSCIVTAGVTANPQTFSTGAPMSTDFHYDN
jgi:hypothetical protein